MAHSGHRHIILPSSLKANQSVVFFVSAALKRQQSAVNNVGILLALLCIVAV